MGRRRRAITCLMGLALLAPMAHSPGHSRPLLDQHARADAYVPPITAEHHDHPLDAGYGFGLSPAGGPCERAYHRALTRSHPSWWDRYEDCVRLEQSR